MYDRVDLVLQFCLVDSSQVCFAVDFYFSAVFFEGGDYEFGSGNVVFDGSCEDVLGGLKSALVWFHGDDSVGVLYLKIFVFGGGFVAFVGGVFCGLVFLMFCSCFFWF